MAATTSRRVEPRRLYQHIADQIRALIERGDLPPLSRLPAERELAQQLGVSRPSLREALIALEIEGRIEIRMGSGVYVCDPGEPPVETTRAFGESPSELMGARAAIEGAVAALAAARMAPGAVDTLRETLARMRAAVQRGEPALDEDRLFHVTIAQQAGNAVLVRLVGDLFDERHSQMSSRISAHFEDRQTWIAAVGEHEAILAALDAADPLWAQAAMHRHLLQSAERWLHER